jgi:hypothetical protein
VVDSAGQPLPGAAIVAVHVPSGTQYAITADAQGNYRIQNMRVGGPYTIKITFIGYLSSRYTDVILKLGEIYVQNAELGVLADRWIRSLSVSSPRFRFPFRVSVLRWI